MEYTGKKREIKNLELRLYVLKAGRQRKSVESNRMWNWRKACTHSPLTLRPESCPERHPAETESACRF